MAWRSVVVTWRASLDCARELASRALDPRTSGRVSPATARRVRAAAEEAGFTPNTAARQPADEPFVHGRGPDAGPHQSAVPPDGTGHRGGPYASGLHRAAGQCRRRRGQRAPSFRRPAGASGRRVHRRHRAAQTPTAGGGAQVRSTHCAPQPLHRPDALPVRDDSTGVWLAVEHLLERGHRYPTSCVVLQASAWG
ncbi:LacI family DNA-binding transcriptional regulator [Streptomyces sp. RLB3-17]|nr:LacI family DNA-binding transcriptional regulator [Streptomyces sp. S1D4-20]QDN74287.1 LacI family DNA-binding transcriptional regulator [Streptomyces sp. S1D4-14]QDO04991.1 LacI family DNA-binding transcriptional regulator [Streptomyces sp. RLB1-9]QDO26781.1 LacI family DNA-binding transcriptional regulator [Streptomyces sp. S1A1-8]QDO36894.1 LacI family DNA-binding transcriptional regulator [Streptomyces sp. S1A1-3]QDO46943.1 LacI family DNA-binding transcriptional regulator [Streptomyces